MSPALTVSSRLSGSAAVTVSIAGAALACEPTHSSAAAARNERKIGSSPKCVGKSPLTACCARRQRCSRRPLHGPNPPAPAGHSKSQRFTPREAHLVYDTAIEAQPEPLPGWHSAGSTGPGRSLRPLRAESLPSLNGSRRRRTGPLDGQPGRGPRPRPPRRRSPDRRIPSRCPTHSFWRRSGRFVHPWRESCAIPRCLDSVRHGTGGYSTSSNSPSLFIPAISNRRMIFWRARTFVLKLFWFPRTIASATNRMHELFI